MREIYQTQSCAQTERLGCELGKKLTVGSVIALVGELGAGKTVLCKGIAQGLGIKDVVVSPTYTIVQEYDGEVPLFHFDVYRIENAGELDDIGFYDYLRSGVCVIEWAGNIAEVLPEKTIWVRIDKLGGEKRQIVVETGE